MSEQNTDQETVKKRVTERLRRDLGPLVEGALNDPKTTDILLNADGQLWLKRLGEPTRVIGTMEAWRATSVIKTLAGLLGKTVGAKEPILDGELPFGNERFAGQLPPVVSSPCFAIRKPAITVFPLDSYVEQGIMTQTQCDAIKKAVRDHKNILVVGGTGSGKTTLINAVIQEMVDNDPNERVFIIEDTGEIQCSAINCVQYHTTLEVSMTDLLKTTLRMLPDRIIVGEVRGSEALDLLDSWNTGHDGGAGTLHANSAESALQRLKSLVTRNKHAPSDIEPLIAEAVHVIVQINRKSEVRRVEAILEIVGYENGNYITNTL
ncbi:P-type conjugative transfer ATPase TrbB [Pseudomonas fragi]|uniref:P-type conjugative transfer ATPase TrbB n=1 Tax=Pseudomonas TaxID=286 RepID=UPI000E76C666|nr:MULTISPECIES: P-type conjugative transfer ATPase TrbB [Pseudomonas]AOA09203.1 P-type conjugative transfer ATPase TrbB [Pseudomonas sp. TMW 2.1634]MBM1202366.1 P-type conjugative transfer ATPase TrbB [Pseudomonas fragi]MDY7572657.1 P-type conjugative transfer ATPase TrbB [Pseudomonas sp. CCC4.1]MEB0143209.1 P-type conjugative transfer ATPase TrbB [Pseudomonas sp. CCC4.1]